MLRHEVNQRLLGFFDKPSYLEIGVQEGTTFHLMQAPRKVAVDPRFHFDVAAMKADPGNAGAVYHEVPSDDYFTGPGVNDRFDLIFIDGNHTFDQSLRDLLNSIHHLKEGGVIVLDDTMPISYASSIPDFDTSAAFRKARGIANDSWMGDVYRLVFFLRDYLPTYHYATVAENHGQTVLWRKTRAHDRAPQKVARIAALDYSDFVFGRDAFNIRPFAEIEQAIAAARAAR